MNRQPATKELLNSVADEVIRMRSGVRSDYWSGQHGADIQTEQLMLSTTNAAFQVGRMPPQPPTIRGRVGAVLVRFIRRCLFWYTEQIHEMNARTAEVIGQQGARIVALTDVIERMRGEQQSLRRELDDASAVLRRVEQERAQTSGSLIALREALDDLHRAIGSEASAREAARHTDRTAAQQDLSARLGEVRDEVRKSIQNVERLAHQTKAALQGQQSRISMLMHERTDAKPSPSAAPPVMAPTTRDLGSLYVEFENEFRGARADIKQRVAVYLPRLGQAGAAHRPVLDLGCGRGEWLEVLAEQGLTGAGVDSNEACVSECRERGLTAHLGDLLEYMQWRPSECEGAVTAFHVVEHMPFGSLLHLLDEAIRILKPGGVLILETPNPANLLVGAHTFYLDPTHIRPIPADLLRFAVESRGFCNVSVTPLHPFDDCYRLNETDGPVAALLNDVIYGPRDYAVIAERP